VFAADLRSKPFYPLTYAIFWGSRFLGSEICLLTAGRLRGIILANHNRPEDSQIRATGVLLTLSAPPAELRRVLKLRDLVFYGIVLVQPIAAVPLFGLADSISHGHVVTVILIAMVAMMLTAISYGRLAAVHPSAGSAYSYVTRELNPYLGFLVGWAMLLDYLIIPVINVVYGSLTLARMLPAIPPIAIKLAMTVLITVLNLRGIKATARANTILLVLMFIVIAAFIGLAFVFLLRQQGLPGIFSFAPFYTPGDTPFPAIATATSLAALTYIGFDGVTTLSEEVENPRRNILLATVYVCLFTGLFSALQVYLAQRVWPDFHTFANLETAFVDVSRLVGGKVLFQGMALTLILASFGSGVSGQAGASRLLFGMGRTGALPRGIFGHLEPSRKVPIYNVLAIGVVTALGSLYFNFETAAELLNFGALLAFMGVNVAAVRRFYLAPQAGNDRRVMRDCVLPAAGALFCFWIWISLPSLAKMAGVVWLALGIVYAVAMTGSLTTAPGKLDFDAAVVADPSSAASNDGSV
jgi:putrescine importer